MEVKEIREIRRKLFDELSQKEEIRKALQFTDEVYVWELEEGSKHEIVVVNYDSQIKGYIRENYNLNNVNLKLLYTINKQTKQVY